MLFKKWLIVLGSILVVSTQAHAFSVTAVGGMNYYSPNWTINGLPAGASAEASGKISYAAGALVSLPVMPAFEVETGALYRANKYNVTATALGTKVSDDTYTMNAIEVPALIRFTGLPIVSFGAGLFYELGVGDISHTDNLTNASTTSSYSNSGIKKSNYGVTVDARAAFPIVPLFKAVVDLRYDLGLRELSTNTTSGGQKSRNFMALAGVSFDF